jgi:hypothetical protein
MEGDVILTDVTSGGSTPVLQTKTVSYTPTESQQTAAITADSGYDGLDEVDVTVNAISSTYVGSGITRRSSSDLTASDTTINVPTGYYAAAASKTLSDANLIAENIKKDVTIFGTTGTYEGSGGGATNIVQGTFTTGATRGSTGTITLNYNGNGYPIEVSVYIAGGPYNNTSAGNTQWYNNKQKYDVAMYSMVKSEITSAPTYSTSGTNNGGFTAVTYKGSTITATSYSRTGATSTNFYTSSSTDAGAGSTSIRMRGNGKTMAYYIGKSTNSTIGLAPSTEYAYIVIYSE